MCVYTFVCVCTCLYDAECLVVGVVFPLVVDQEGVELAYAPGLGAQRGALHTGAVGHDAGGGDGIPDLSLAVRDGGPRPQRQAHIRPRTSQQV